MPNIKKNNHIFNNKIQITTTKQQTKNNHQHKHKINEQKTNK